MAAVECQHTKPEAQGLIPHQDCTFFFQKLLHLGVQQHIAKFNKYMQINTKYQTIQISIN